MLKMEDIKTMNVEDMQQKILALKKELLTLRIELKTGKLEKHGKIRDNKKSIARLMTIINEEKGKAPSKPVPAPGKKAKK